MGKPTIASGYASALLDFAVSRGANRTVLVERSMIDSEELLDRNNRLALGKYVALTRAGAELCADAALSLHFGERVDVSEISIACVVGGATSIDTAIAQLNRYASLGVDVEAAGDGERFQLRRRRGQLWFVDQRRNPNEFPELTEMGFARLICSMRRMLGDYRIFEQIHFTHPAPVYLAEYERIFQVPLFFGTNENAMQIDEAKLAGVRRSPSSQIVNEVLKDHAESLLAKLATGKSTRGRVEMVLTPMLKEGTANIETTARRLGLSRQTLFRKLKSEGVTFEKVLSELRCSLASHSLKESKISVKETAHLLGFSDPAAFSRAYKRWTGHPPVRDGSDGM